VRDTVTARLSTPYRRLRDHWVRRERALATLVGPDAARLINAYCKWVFAAFACLFLPTPLALAVHTDSSGAGLALTGLFLLGVGCLIRGFRLAGRGARLAEAYLANQVGHPVRIVAPKLSVSWWRTRIERERRQGPWPDRHEGEDAL
jgi:hypothetical protein